MSKYIFVTGGVISGLGKGIIAASIGNLLKHRGYKIFVLKLDPYLNVDPGVISPYEHGEVYVTADGGETDLDLGHYERFIGENFTKDSNFTSGKIFSRILEKERKGSYNGKTVQFIPHVTNEIKDILKSIEKKYKPDFLIVEIGGTVGDIESNPFIYALAEMSYDKKNQSTFFAHVTYVPYLKTSKDFKTKPTQNSIRALNSMGIKPNMVFLRADKDIDNEIVEKVARFSLLEKNSVISMPDLESVYDAPLWLETKKIAATIEKHFNLKSKIGNIKEWKKFADQIKVQKQNKIKIAMVGKYIEFPDSYKSIIEATRIAASYLDTEVEFKWIDAGQLTSQNIAQTLVDTQATMILPGFGHRGFEGKVLTAIYTRQKDIPTFGICLGMQAMSVAQARLNGFPKATSSEFQTGDKEEVFVLDIIPGKQGNLGGTLRIGNQNISLKEDSLFAKYYQSKEVVERHRHRYEVQEFFKNNLPDGDFDFPAFNPQTGLVEACEVKSKRFYLGTQYHPEFSGKPLKPHKLFLAFIESIIKGK
ncbi:CTP synthase [Mycoplasma iguanae]|uniref:CTP synthase (glutamine hydrolyzing) n=1 Tax=Mycoplasma iguanae TaxID=292461 RepID=A0ABY5R7T6_9MOLU|nr:CTP synthase [Mycoplasma iguanae]UVD81543.1 CTP synthase [Mycoplasma iguanae]